MFRLNGGKNASGDSPVDEKHPGEGSSPRPGSLLPPKMTSPITEDQIPIVSTKRELESCVTRNIFTDSRLENGSGSAYVKSTVEGSKSTVEGCGTIAGAISRTYSSEFLSKENLRTESNITDDRSEHIRSGISDVTHNYQQNYSHKLSDKLEIIENNNSDKGNEKSLDTNETEFKQKSDSLSKIHTFIHNNNIENNKLLETRVDEDEIVFRKKSSLSKDMRRRPLSFYDDDVIKGLSENLDLPQPIVADQSQTVPPINDEVAASRKCADQPDLKRYLRESNHLKESNPYVSSKIKKFSAPHRENEASLKNLEDFFTYSSEEEHLESNENMDKLSNRDNHRKHSSENSVSSLPMSSQVKRKGSIIEKSLRQLGLQDSVYFKNKYRKNSKGAVISKDTSNIRAVPYERYRPGHALIESSKNTVSLEEIRGHITSYKDLQRANISVSSQDLRQSSNALLGNHKSDSYPHLKLGPDAMTNSQYDYDDRPLPPTEDISMVQSCLDIGFMHGDASAIDLSVFETTVITSSDSYIQTSPTTTLSTANTRESFLFPKPNYPGESSKFAIRDSVERGKATAVEEDMADIIKSYTSKHEFISSCENTLYQDNDSPNKASLPISGEPLVVPRRSRKMAAVERNFADEMNEFCRKSITEYDPELSAAGVYIVTSDQEFDSCSSVQSDFDKFNELCSNSRLQNDKLNNLCSTVRVRSELDRQYDCKYSDKSDYQRNLRADPSKSDTTDEYKSSVRSDYQRLVREEPFRSPPKLFPKARSLRRNLDDVMHFNIKVS